jgi:hypothetical protein
MSVVFAVARLLLAATLVAGSLTALGIAVFVYAWVGGDATPYEGGCVGGHTAYGVALVSLGSVAVVTSVGALVQAVRLRRVWWFAFVSLGCLLVGAALFFGAAELLEPVWQC